MMQIYDYSVENVVRRLNMMMYMFVHLFIIGIEYCGEYSGAIVFCSLLRRGWTS